MMSVRRFLPILKKDLEEVLEYELPPWHELISLNIYEQYGKVIIHAEIKVNAGFPPHKEECLDAMETYTEQYANRYDVEQFEYDLSVRLR